MSEVDLSCLLVDWFLPLAALGASTGVLFPYPRAQALDFLTAIIPRAVDDVSAVLSLALSTLIEPYRYALLLTNTTRLTLRDGLVPEFLSPFCRDAFHGPGDTVRVFVELFDLRLCIHIDCALLDCISSQRRNCGRQKYRNNCA